MANSWLRLWHDMPTDPKFRVVAKASQQPLHLVIAVYVTLLCDASKNDLSRGVTQCHEEDIAVTVECDMSQVTQIKAAMQGRLLDGDRLTGWKNRQPLREDLGDEKTGTKSSAQRKREQRLRESPVDNSVDNNHVTKCHAESRNVTLDKDKDKDIEVSTPTTEFAPSAKSPSGSALPKNWSLPASWAEWARTERPDLDPNRVAEEFHDYWVAKPGKDGRKSDWEATWRNWIRKQQAIGFGRQSYSATQMPRGLVL